MSNGSVDVKGAGIQMLWRELQSAIDISYQPKFWAVNADGMIIFSENPEVLGAVPFPYSPTAWGLAYLVNEWLRSLSPEDFKLRAGPEPVARGTAIRGGFHLKTDAGDLPNVVAVIKPFWCEVGKGQRTAHAQ